MLKSHYYAELGFWDYDYITVAIVLAVRMGVRRIVRLREAIVAALRYNVELAKKDRSDTLRINEQLQFVSSGFRAKYQRQPEVRLSVSDCLSEDWYLMKDGKEFVPDSCYYT